MAQNNALAVATLVMADEKATTDEVFPTDKLETLCNLYKYHLI